MKEELLGWLAYNYPGVYREWINQEKTNEIFKSITSKK